LDAATPDLLAQATSILTREVGRLPGALAAIPAPGAPLALPAPPVPGASSVDLGGLTCPVVGAKLPLPGAGQADLRQQAHELLASIFAGLGQPSIAPSAESTCPVTKASVPTGFDKDAIRRQAHEFIDTLLVTFREATGEDGVVAEHKVPLIQCAAPARAGGVARATLTVANDEPTPSDVSLYSSNFVADFGYEIPSLRVSATPRVASIPPKGQTTFEIKIAVPAQAPAGTYSGLLQAVGSKYVKAVLSVQVL
jgi:hypothetical protein